MPSTPRLRRTAGADAGASFRRWTPPTPTPRAGRRRAASTATADPDTAATPDAPAPDAPAPGPGGPPPAEGDPAAVALPGPTWTARVLDLDPLPGAFGPRGRRAPRDRAVLLRDAAETPAATTGEHAVLHLPGFRDYFFHVQYAQEWVDAGFAFHALEPRRSGRALRAGEVPDDLTDLRHRHPEIAAAIRELRAGGARTVTLAGNSLGALHAALYAHDHPADVDALVLASPWLSAPRCFTPPTRPLRLAPLAARLNPRATWSKVINAHTSAEHVDHGGDFRFDTTLKTVGPFAVHTGFVAAVARGLRELDGLGLTMPVLVAVAAATGDPRRLADLRSCEVVLDVAKVRAAAAGLGTDVTVTAIRGGAHDLALSPRPARDEFLAAVTEWAAARRPSG